MTNLMVTFVLLMKSAHNVVEKDMAKKPRYQYAKQLVQHTVQNFKVRQESTSRCFAQASQLSRKKVEQCSIICVQQTVAV